MKVLRRIMASFLVAFCFVGLLTGCSNKTTQNEKIQVTDMLGTTIEINKNPKKVACISRTTYDLLVAYGLGDKIDGAYSGTLNNDWVSLIYPNSKNHYVYSYENSYELFMQRGVDLVFAPEKYIADDLNSHNIPALCVSLYGNPTFDEYVTFLSKLVTQIWDDAQIKTKAEAWENKVTKAINDIKSELDKHDIEKKTVFYIRGDKDKGVGYTDSKSSFTERSGRMKSHKRKMVAPIVVAILMILYFVIYFGFLISLLNGIWKIALGVIPLALSAVMIKVCIERIREIKKGEEDDISQY